MPEPEAGRIRPSELAEFHRTYDAAKAAYRKLLEDR
jgi:hypothetical protein